MKSLIFGMLFLFLTVAAVAGELYGTIIEAGKPIPAGAKIEATVAGKIFAGETDMFVPIIQSFLRPGSASLDERMKDNGRR